MQQKAALVKNEYGVYPVIELENEALKIDVLPAMGGKILQVFDKKSGAALLKESEADLRNTKLPQKEQSFLPPYAAGFDECFPTVSPCKIQFEEKTLDLPDHGELWTQSWDYISEGDTVTLSAIGDQLDYRFTKHIRLKKTGISIEYELENRETLDLDYIWSAHPLLEVEAGDEFLLPEEIREVVLNWSSNPKLGSFGDRLTWPHLADTQTDFSIVQAKNEDLALKLFSDRLKTGRAGVYRKKINRSLVFSFDVEQIPFLGIWLCYGGWPEGKVGQYTVALEPCSGRPDSLEKAKSRREQKTIAANGLKKWQLEISIFDDKQGYQT